ncbi:M15 family metallopeptidase [Paenibacillus sp. sgz500958]|uniref:M15 family metallopeptidase n=1 Tax=Paenibacillus sp. sgz500958 TaxID=3242475 RepID=UPI0036D321F8
MLTQDQVISRSSTRLSGLHPVVLNAATLLIERCYTSGVPILITQGLRTIAEQNALYAQGRTAPGSIVTNAKGGCSYHNYGLAVDFALLLPDGKAVSWDMKRDDDNDREADWLEVVRHAKALGFEWGGDWTGFKDYPHLQLTFGLSIDQLRAGAKPSQTAIAAAEAIIRKNNEMKTAAKYLPAAVQVNGIKVADGLLNPEEGVTYAPIRVLATAFGAKLSYDPATRTVNITTRQAENR